MSHFTAVGLACNPRGPADAPSLYDCPSSIADRLEVRGLNPDLAWELALELVKPAPKMPGWMLEGLREIVEDEA